MAKSGVNEERNSDVTLKNDDIIELNLHQLNIIPRCNSKEDPKTNEPSALSDGALVKEVDSERYGLLNCNESDKSANRRNHFNSYDNGSSTLSLDLKDDAFGSVVTLDFLPYEIILHIVSYLDSEFIVSTLSKVCSSFRDLFDDVNFWKSRIRRRWPKEYPALPAKDPEMFDWKEACIKRELEFCYWSNVATKLDYFVFEHGLYGAVDTVHLVETGNLLAVGSRDRYLNILDVTKLKKEDESSSVSCRIFCKDNAHDGWIWTINSFDRTLSTGSWDTRIRFWDLPTMAQIHEAKANSAILCSHFESNLYIAGGYDKNVYQFDPRLAGVLSKNRYHSKPILCLLANDNYVMTGSEDSTVALYDRRRTGAVVKKQKLQQYPMSMSYDDGQLWVGDKGGSVHLLDASSGDLRLVKTYNVGHAQKVTGIIHTPGILITCSTDKTVKVLEPNLNPGLIVNLTEMTSEVAEISYRNGVLACASSGMCVGIYKRREDDQQ